MFKRILLIGLLGIGLAVLLGVDASEAAVCTRWYYVGTKPICGAWSGSIECGIQAIGVGNALTDPVYLACTATGTNEWAVACGNPGENTWTSPGINVINFNGGTIGGSIQLTAQMIDKNGNAYATVYGSPDNALLLDLWAKGACPNANWEVIDAVPCTMTLLDTQLDANKCVTAEAHFTCTLPNCSTLGWDAAAQKFERRQYECTLDWSRKNLDCPKY